MVMLAQTGMNRRAQPGTDVQIPSRLAEKYPQELQGKLTDLSMFLRGQFEWEVRNRVDVEDRWLQDLRQYKGLYEPDEWRRLKEEPSRSRVFYRITRKKVRAFDSRMMDMLFPGGKQKNWSIKATPEPDMNLTPLARNLLEQRQQEILQEIAQQLGQENNLEPEAVMQRLQAQGVPIEVPEEDMRLIRKEAAEAACERMDQTMADQLATINYKKICRQVIHSGHVYGVGLLKSPLAQKKLKATFVFDGQRWGMEHREYLMPFMEFVPVWNFYPASSSRSMEDMPYCYQRHVMDKGEVLGLGDRPGFDRELIRRYLDEFPDGDCEPRGWEVRLDGEGKNSGETKSERTHKKYEVIEYWGPFNDRELRDLGFESESVAGVWMCVWVLGDFVIKLGASPIEGMDHLYHAYQFEEDETSFWSEGIPSVIRDDQVSLNAANRAMMDNAAQTAGAAYEVNTDLVSPRENVRDIRPNKVILRSGDSRQPAVRDIQTQSRINEFLAVRGMFEQQIHESTIPAYMQGGSTGGAGRTASGLSMLMGSASMDVKDQVMQFDTGITKPVIRSLYHWNMALNEDPYIKGDFEVVAMGSSSLMAKEVIGQQLDQLLPVLSNPMYAPFVDKRKLLEMMLQIRDLTDTGILLSPERYEELEALRQQVGQLQQQVEQGRKLLENVWRVAPNLVQQAMDRTEPAQLAG